jgi:uncharacterized protein
MIDDEFEWDDAKAARNLVVHAIAFDTARGVFRDPLAVGWLDERHDYGRDRYSRVGTVEGRLLHVAYTMRGDRTRIISARGAEPFERRRYHEDD